MRGPDQDDWMDNVFVDACAAAIRREHRGEADRFVAGETARMRRAGNQGAQQTWARIGRRLVEITGPDREW
jgi:hypothetical protein